MRAFWRLTAAAVVLIGLALSGGSASAQLGQPADWQLGLQLPATSLMAEIRWFHDFLMWIISAIALLVLALLVYVVVRYNARAHPIPSRITHNTAIEVLWTVVPVLILVVIAVPSFRILFHQVKIPPADLTIKATGKQWYWTYAYPDQGNFEFDSLMLQDKELKPGQPRLLAVDNEIVVPVNKTVRVQVTAADVIHAFAVPSFGIKIDAVPGRLNETWFNATREGVFYGQCSELCGKDHAFMPISVRVVSEQEFASWVDQAKKRYARNDSRPATLAASSAPAAQRY